MEPELIKRGVVEMIIQASRKVYPLEFIGLLRKNGRGEIDTLLLIPNSTSGEGFSGIRDDMLPIGLDKCGSIHSHPSRNARPSSVDLNFFSRKGSVHIIIGYPYTEDTIRVYSSDGEPLEFRIID